jgi:hypothetical protein
MRERKGYMPRPRDAERTNDNLVRGVPQYRTQCALSAAPNWGFCPDSPIGPWIGHPGPYRPTRSSFL